MRLSSMTWSAYQRFQRRWAWRRMLRGLREVGTAMRSCAAAARGTTDAVQRWQAAWDALPEATKAEVRRLDG